MDGTGKPGAETITFQESGVYYHHEATPNFPQLSGAGRVIEASVLTTEHGHFDIAQTVPDMGYLKRTTPGPVTNTVYRILSGDQSTPSLGNRKANKASYPLREVEKPPTLPTS